MSEQKNIMPLTIRDSVRATVRSRSATTTEAPDVADSAIDQTVKTKPLPRNPARCSNKEKNMKKNKEVKASEIDQAGRPPKAVEQVTKATDPHAEQSVAMCMLRAADQLYPDLNNGHLSSILRHAVMSIEAHLTKAEFLVVVDSVRGLSTTEINLLDVHIGDKTIWDGGGFLDDLSFSENQNVDGHALAVKLGRWKPIQRLALLNAVDAWLSEHNQNNKQQPKDNI